MSTPPVGGSLALSVRSTTTSVLVGSGEEGVMSASKGFSTDGAKGGESGEEEGKHEV